MRRQSAAQGLQWHTVALQDSHSETLARLEFAEQTRQGARSENQDCYCHLLTPGGALFVVADGVGGRSDGGQAARFFTLSLLRLAEAHLDALEREPRRALRGLIAKAGGELYAAFQRVVPGVTPRTTCVAAWLNDHGLTCAHVGDSRAYLVGREGVLWRSRDHSLVQRLVDRGTLNRRAAARHPAKSQIYRSIGGGRRVQASVKRLPPLQAGQAGVLCTDGFWEQLRGRELVALTDDAPLDQSLSLLVDLALARGGPNADNITAQAFRLR